MQKFKKALKKLATLGSKTVIGKKSATPAAQPAKKAPPVKKKSQPVVASKKAPAKKTAPIKAAPKAVAKPIKAKPTVAPHKVEKHDPNSKKKPAPQAVAAKPAAKTEDKHPIRKAAVATPAPAQRKTEKETPAVTEKAPMKAAAEAPTATPTTTIEAKTKAPKKVREEVEIVEQAEDEEVILTDADGRRYCRVKDCDQASTVDGYCRFHYLLFWKNIQNRKEILREGKLGRYIEELTARYPDKYLEMLRKDLRSEKEFLAAIQELEIDESGNDSEFEDEAQNYLDEVRGMSSEAGAGARDEEDF
jgi:hypothetical protein